MSVKIWLCIDEKDKNPENLPLLNTYNNCKVLGEAFNRARKEFPQYSEYSLIGRRI